MIVATLHPKLQLRNILLDLIIDDEAVHDANVGANHHQLCVCGLTVLHQLVVRQPAGQGDMHQRLDGLSSREAKAKEQRANKRTVVIVEAVSQRGR